MQYITGNKFKNICHHTYDENGYIIHSEPYEKELLIIFVKIDFVHLFFKIKQTRNYILITHNGDMSVDNRCLQYLDDLNLITWYGQNIDIQHPKIKSIPIGIANEIWEHGNEYIFNKILSQKYTKNKLLYINFDINTNKNERNCCVEELLKKGLKLENKLQFEDYLTDVAKSYFIVSPNGNGIDCHKTWEALYLKTIPIITKSINSSFYNNLPIIIIDNWKDFDPSIFTVEKYNKIWNNFNINTLDINFFLNK